MSSSMITDLNARFTAATALRDALAAECTGIADAIAARLRALDAELEQPRPMRYDARPRRQCASAASLRTRKPSPSSLPRPNRSRASGPIRSRRWARAEGAR